MKHDMYTHFIDQSNLAFVCKSNGLFYCCNNVVLSFVKYYDMFQHVQVCVSVLSTTTIHNPDKKMSCETLKSYNQPRVKKLLRDSHYARNASGYSKLGHIVVVNCHL